MPLTIIIGERERNHHLDEKTHTITSHLEQTIYKETERFKQVNHINFVVVSKCVCVITACMYAGQECFYIEHAVFLSKKPLNTFKQS